jgi:hypothetical protein
MTCDKCNRELAPVRPDVFQCENRRCYQPIGAMGEIIREEAQYCKTGCAGKAAQ